MLTHVIIVGAAILVGGCGSIQIASGGLVIDQVGQRPDLNDESVATIGNPIFEQYQYKSKVGNRLLEGIDIRFKMGRIVASAGEFVVPAYVEGAPAYCTESRAYYDYLVGPLTTACFKDENGDGTFEMALARPGGVVYESRLDHPIPYAKSEVILNNTDGFKREIIYEGYSNKTLRLYYREFIGDMVRPIYAQEATYEITSFPLDITFKSLLLEISSAGNNGIAYKVKRGF